MKSPYLSTKPLKDSELGPRIRRDSVLLVSPWWGPRAGSSPTVDLQPQQDKYSYVPGLPPFSLHLGSVELPFISRVWAVVEGSELVEFWLWPLNVWACPHIPHVL